jgi:hypothetical protein
VTLKLSGQKRRRLPVGSLFLHVPLIFFADGFVGFLVNPALFHNRGKGVSIALLLFGFHKNLVGLILELEIGMATIAEIDAIHSALTDKILPSS